MSTPDRHVPMDHASPVYRSPPTSRSRGKWWFAGEKGKSFLQVKYDARTLELMKGKNSVEVSNDAELIQTLELIKKAVESGELDQQIEAASER